MPRILEFREFEEKLWVRVGVPGDFPNGAALWAPEEQEEFRTSILLEAIQALHTLKDLG